jgi:hypothetical protein
MISAVAPHGALVVRIGSRQPASNGMWTTAIALTGLVREFAELNAAHQRHSAVCDGTSQECASTFDPSALLHTLWTAVEKSSRAHLSSSK